MSYGMHDYLTEKAMQRQYMQKYAANDPKTGANSPEPGMYSKLKDIAVDAYSRSRAFLAEHPEILYGLGGVGIGAGIGALVSPKRRLLGSLIGMGLGGALGYGGKWAWDKYNVGNKIAMAGQDLKQKYNKIRYGEQLQGMNPKEHDEHIKSLEQAGLLTR